jgi:hypothetical protein
VSDTPPASGNTKRISINNILACSPSATLASATITGNLTTQGTQVKLSNQAAADCTILIGPDTASAARSGRIGYVTSSVYKNWFLASSWNTAGGFEFTQSTAAGGTTMAATPSFRINADSTFDFLDGAGGTRMTLNSTGLGVGTVPANGLKLSSFVTTDGAPATSGTTQTSGSFRVGATSTAGAMDMGTAGSYSWIQALDRTNLATNYNLALQPNGGNLLVGKTSTAATAGGGVVYLGRLDSARDTGDAATFKHTTLGNTVGSISITNVATAYNTSSDYRLKESVKPISGGLARINALKPSIYNWKSDGSTGEGFLAHELAEVVPLAVSGEKDAVNEDGSIKTQGVDLSKLVPILVAAIQELTAEVNALKNA